MRPRKWALKEKKKTIKNKRVQSQYQRDDMVIINLLNENGNLKQDLTDNTEINCQSSEC